MADNVSECDLKKMRKCKSYWISYLWIGIVTHPALGI